MSDSKVSVSTHVIFDFCGTIADLFGNIGTAIEDYALSVGKVVSSSLCDETLSREGSSGLFKCLVNTLEIEKDEKHLKEFENKITSMVTGPGIKMIPGVDKLINHLYKHNIPMAIASDGKRLIELAQSTEGFDLNKFSHIVSGLEDPEVKNNKPAPDIYLLCANRFKMRPTSLDRCVVFEDSICGITGAVATGMKTVLINNNNSVKLNPIADKITVIVDSYDDFKPESVGLPPY